MVTEARYDAGHGVTLRRVIFSPTPTSLGLTLKTTSCCAARFLAALGDRPTCTRVSGPATERSPGSSATERRAGRVAGVWRAVAAAAAAGMPRTAVPAVTTVESPTASATRLVRHTAGCVPVALAPIDRLDSESVSDCSFRSVMQRRLVQ